MKFFVNIKKKKLKRKLHEYTLQSQDALAKSESLSILAERYSSLATAYLKDPNYYIALRLDIETYLNKAEECKSKSDHYKHLSDMYLNMKADVEKELSELN